MPERFRPNPDQDPDASEVPMFENAQERLERRVTQEFEGPPRDDDAAAAVPEDKDQQQREVHEPDSWPASKIVDLDSRGLSAHHEVYVQRQLDSQGRLIAKDERTSILQTSSMGLEFLHSRNVPETTRTELVYGPDGRVSEERLFNQDFNENWRPKAVRRHRVNAETGQTEVTTFDAKGRPTGQREVASADRRTIEYFDKRGQTFRCVQEFDAAGRPLTQTFFDAKGKVASVREYVYGPKEVRTTFRDAKGKVEKTLVERPQDQA